MKTTVGSLAVLTCWLGLVFTADAAAPQPWTGSLDATVANHTSNIRDDYQAHVNYLSDVTPRGDRKVFLAIHGFLHTSNVWNSFCGRLVANYSADVHRCYALDLTGHGQSGYRAAKVGYTDLADYVEAIEATVARIKTSDPSLKPGDIVLVGHSMGAELMMLLRQHLGATKLFDSFGVRDFIFAQPALPEQIPWPEAETAEIYATFARLATYSVATGPISQAEHAAEWRSLFFAKRSSKTLWPTVPSAQDVDAISSFEPAKAGSELLGLDSDLQRPLIDKGAFSRSDLDLMFVAATEDQYISTAEVGELKAHLTNSANQSCNDQANCYSIANIHDAIWSAPNSSDASERGQLDQAVESVLAEPTR